MVKIFSNFDTMSPSKNYAKAVQDFWYDKVIFVRRHKLYLILYSIIPLAAGIALIVLSALLSWSRRISLTTNTQHVLQVIIILIAIYCLLLSLSKYFNYLLDYTIVTPVYLGSYNQIGLFSRDVKTIEPMKIKSIDFSSDGVINSIFDFWKIIILLEGDDEGQGEIILDFIHKPEAITDGIKQLIEGNIAKSEMVNSL